MKKFILFVLNFLFLTACTNLLEVQQLPKQTPQARLFKVEQLNRDKSVQQASLLTLQVENAQWRWVQTDPLGSPIARVVLSEKGWQNDGFVMPNPQAVKLFSAIATYLNPNQPLFQFSQITQEERSHIYFIKNQEVWRITENPPQFLIKLADESQWNIEELAQ